MDRLVHGQAAVRALRLMYRLGMKVESFRGADEKLEMASYVPLYRRIWHEAAKRLSADITELAEGIWTVSAEGRSTIIANYRVALDHPVALQLAGDKALSYRFLMQNGLPVPDHLAYSLHEIRRLRPFMEKIPGDLFVVKPAAGTAASRGITTHLGSYREAYLASILGSLWSDRLLIERLIPGESYRLLVLECEVIHASRRNGVRVAGDGRSTLRRLLERISPGSVRHDRDFFATLKAQGLSENFVPSSGEEVLVKSVARFSEKFREVCTFYDEDVTDRIGPDLREKAVLAARTLGLRFAGVDIITWDPTKPLSQTGGVIHEVNTTPGLHHHYNLIHQSDPPPAVRVLRYLLKQPDKYGLQPSESWSCAN